MFHPSGCSAAARSGSQRLGSRAAAALCLATLAAGAPACTPRASVAPRAPSAAAGAVGPMEITDEKFASETAALVREREGEPGRVTRLVGVVRYQLARASTLFDSGHEEAGLDAVEGALYLVRAGEFQPSMIEGRTSALMAAANAVARHGSEGRAMALYSMLSKALPPGPDRTEVEAHLGAIKQWEDTTRSQGPLQAAGGDERAAVDRALWDPNVESLHAGRDAIVEWIDRAMSYGKDQVPPSDDFERDEAIEAYRAVRTGAMALAALYLRNGNPKGAIEAMETPRIARVVSPASPRSAETSCRRERSGIVAGTVRHLRSSRHRRSGRRARPRAVPGRRVGRRRSSSIASNRTRCAESCRSPHC